MPLSNSPHFCTLCHLCPTSSSQFSTSSLWQLKLAPDSTLHCTQVNNALFANFAELISQYWPLLHFGTFSSHQFGLILHLWFFKAITAEQLRETEMTGNAAEWERGRRPFYGRILCSRGKKSRRAMVYKSKADGAGLGRVHMRSCTSVECIREDWGWWWLPAGAHHTTPRSMTLYHTSLWCTDPN